VLRRSAVGEQPILALTGGAGYTDGQVSETKTPLGRRRIAIHGGDALRRGPVVSFYVLDKDEWPGPEHVGLREEWILLELGAL
jgi:hypothetical protein